MWCDGEWEKHLKYSSGSSINEREMRFEAEIECLQRVWVVMILFFCCKKRI